MLDPKVFLIEITLSTRHYKEEKPQPYVTFPIAQISKSNIASELLILYTTYYLTFSSQFFIDISLDFGCTLSLIDRSFLAFVECWYSSSCLIVISLRLGTHLA